MIEIDRQYYFHCCFTFQTLDYQDPQKKLQGRDLITDERDQIEDLDVFQYDMKELSDQITLICSTYFRAITSQELLYRLSNLYNLQNYMKFLDKVVRRLKENELNAYRCDILARLLV